MSARHVRRSFAAPFVVTLAGAASVAAVGCTKKAAPLHHNPPRPEEPGKPHSNPPPPETKPDAPARRSASSITVR